MKNSFNILILTILFIGCGQKFSHVPGNIIEPEKFTDIVTDLRLAEANQNLLQQQGIRNENLLDSSYHLIYKIHDVTQRQVESSFEFYVLHPEWMDKISNDVIDRLNHMEH